MKIYYIPQIRKKTENTLGLHAMKPETSLKRCKLVTMKTKHLGIKMKRNYFTE